MTGTHNINIQTEQDCLRVPRCHLVLQELNKPINDQDRLIDAKFGSSHKVIAGAVPIDTHPHVTPPTQNKLKMSEMLRYKAIIILEGNDVASGLKWALFSQSVVLMPPPTKTSWAMEEWLQPWVHYIPIDLDLSNVEERVHWMCNNDDEAKKIAQRASLFIYDLLFHNDAEKEDAMVKEGLLKLYWSCFQK